MTKVFLTGGDGYFGRRFRERYGRIFEIRSTDKADLDITDADGVMELMRNFKPDVTVYAAALLVTDFCEKNPEVCWRVNVQGALNVAEGCRELGTKMAFISTEQVFNGNVGPGPFREDDIPQPNTVYGRNKLEVETRLAGMVPGLWILRFAWTFGFPERNLPLSPNLFWEVVRAALLGKRLKVPVNELRSLTYIYDIIDQFSLSRRPGIASTNYCKRIVKNIRTSRGTSGSIRQKSHATASRSPKRGMDFADSFRSSDSYPESADLARYFVAVHLVGAST